MYSHRPEFSVTTPTRLHVNIATRYDRIVWSPNCRRPRLPPPLLEPHQQITHLQFVYYSSLGKGRERKREKKDWEGENMLMRLNEAYHCLVPALSLQLAVLEIRTPPPCQGETVG